MLLKLECLYSDKFDIRAEALQFVNWQINRINSQNKQMNILLFLLSRFREFQLSIAEQRMKMRKMK